MSTIRSQILSAVTTKLNESATDVFSNLDDALGKEVTKAIIAGRWTDVTEEVGMLDKHTLTLPTGVFARGAAADADADALNAEVYGLMVVDRSFGGLVKKLSAGPASGDGDAEGGKTVRISQAYTLEYWTQRGSLTEGP
jgi:hypothetical protein